MFTHWIDWTELMWSLTKELIAFMIYRNSCRNIHENRCLFLEWRAVLCISLVDSNSLSDSFYIYRLCGIDKAVGIVRRLIQKIWMKYLRRMNESLVVKCDNYCNSCKCFVECGLFEVLVWNWRIGNNLYIQNRSITLVCLYIR